MGGAAYARGVQPDRREPDDADERAWRAIVENYGDRPRLDDETTGGAPTDEPTGPAEGTEAAGSADLPAEGGGSAGGASTAPFGGRFGDPRAFAEDEDEPFVGEEERFEPPEPPPLPRVSPDRGLAWLGVLGSPVVLLAALIFSISLPSLVGYALVIAFVGGFAYLVYTMPREPRDPWDDGAQV